MGNRRWKRVVSSNFRSKSTAEALRGEMVSTYLALCYTNYAENIHDMSQFLVNVHIYYAFR